MDGPGGSRVKSVREKEISYDITYMWNDTNELAYKKTQTHKENLWFPKVKGGVV